MKLRFKSVSFDSSFKHLVADIDKAELQWGPFNYCSYKFRNIHRKTSESLFNKVAGVRPATLLKIKKDSTQVFPVKSVKFVRHLF